MPTRLGGSIAARVVAGIVCSIVVIVAMGLAIVRAQPGRSTDIEMPPISWTCPMVGALMPDGSMHADVVEDREGSCPICQMALVAVRLDRIYTCPVHAVIAEKKPGTCPLDRRDLVPTTVQMSWTCKARPDINDLAPGTCPDGSSRVVKYTPRPHGNHNPQHDGVFFMAPDNWHHLEGAFPEPGIARIYLYDDFTKPLSLDRLKAVSGRIVTKETFESAERVTTDVMAFPLVLAGNQQYLEARVDSRTLPASMIAKLTLKPDGPEYRFDFIFTEFSKDVAAAGAAKESASDPNPLPSGFLTQMNPGSYERTMPVPPTLEGIMAEMKTHSLEIRGLIDKGAFADMWVPAFQSKDLAIAMGSHSSELPTYKRAVLEPAIARLVRSAWLLDAFGDLGNREQIDGTYAEFVAALAEIDSLFETGR